MKWPTIKINIVTLWKLYKFFKKYVLRKEVRKNSLVKDKWDERDRYYKVSWFRADLPVSTNRKNIEEFTHRYDQGNLGSCCAFGAVEAFRRVLQVNGMPDWDGSPLFAYWTLRVDKNRDCGGQIRDAFKALNLYGLCNEKTWPYNTRKFRDVPSQEAFIEGLEHQSIVYERIYPVTKEAIMDAISQGFPIVFGADLFASFETDWVKSTGIVPFPGKCDPFVGGHCMVIMDYEETGVFILNSWGKEWGIDGTGHMPWEYILKEEWCNDFWVLYKSE